MAVVIVNDKPVDIGNERLNLVQAAAKAGEFVPHYCWHPSLSVVASCRMCLVEVDKAAKRNVIQPVFNEANIFRAKTAPVKSSKSLDNFRKSTVFLLIEKALAAASIFLGNLDLQFNIDNPEEQMACKTFLSCAEDLHNYLGCSTADRDYRQTFSKAYLILYKESKLCYLTEILDSAQEC